MASNHDRRLTVLENRGGVSQGNRTVYTSGDGVYWELPGIREPRCAMPYAPADAALLTAADVEAMQRDGWALTIIEYQQDWRARSSAVLQFLADASALGAIGGPCAAAQLPDGWLPDGATQGGDNEVERML